MRSTLSIWLAVALSGCAAAQPTPHSAPPSDTQAAKRAPSRDLGKDASFADLVAAIAAEESALLTPRRCLLARSDTGFRLEAELAAAIHPISPPIEDLDPILLRSREAQVLSRWGRHGVSLSTLKLAGLTDAPPTRGAEVLILTDQGAYLRTTGEAPLTPGSARPDAQITTLLGASAATFANLTLFVTAESNVSVARLSAVLDELFLRYPGPVVLALALAPDTVLPAPRATTAAARRCPDGLSDSQGLEGDLAVSALTDGLSPLRPRAASCLEHADAGGAAGGRLLLGLRIRPDGSVEQACMIADETQDDALAACVLAAAHDLHFAAPSPPGFVDVELPLLLRANSAPAQPAVCERTQAPSAP